MARIINFVSVLILVVVACHFYYFVFQNAVNVPYFDDFAYLRYTLEFLDSPDILDFLGKFLDKHNGHGILTAKFAFWLDYCLEGEINFRNLIIAGSTLVLFIFGYFALILRRNNLQAAYLLPVGLFLFSPAYHENIFWAAASWQYCASFVMGIMMYYLVVRKENWTFVLAIVFGFITTYTNGNGLVGFFAGSLLLLLQGKMRRAVVWFASAALTAVVFYWYYPYGMGTSEGHHLRAFLTTLISFAGAVGIYLRSQRFEVILAGIPLALGLVLLLLWIAVDYFNRYFHYFKRLRVLPIFARSPENLSLLGVMLWMMITGLGTSLTRASVHFDAPLRYMIYSIMIVVVLYTAILILSGRVVSSIVFGLTVISGLVFQFGSYLYAAPDVINFRNTLWADAYNLKKNAHVSGKVETMNPLVANVFKESVARGLYVYPETPLAGIDLNMALQADTTAVEPLSFSITRDTLKAYSGILITKIENDTITLDQSDFRNAVFIVLKSVDGRGFHIFAVAQRPNFNRKGFLTSGRHFEAGFVASVFGGNAPVGRYQIGLLKVENGIHRLAYTNQAVDLLVLPPNDKYR